VKNRCSAVRFAHFDGGSAMAVLDDLHGEK
jgi:hypothetical protein